MLRAAPSAMGMEIAMPTTEEAMVITMLSSIPDQMSDAREVKSGVAKASMTKAAPALQPLVDAGPVHLDRDHGEVR